MKDYISLKEYLISLNLLGSTDAEAVAFAKKEYRREYMKTYKQQRRKRIHEIVMSIDAKQYLRFKKQAKRHSLSVPRFLLHIADSYCNKLPITQHPECFSSLELLMAQVYSEVVYISDNGLEEDTGMKSLKTRILNIENELGKLSRPQDLKGYLMSTISKDNAKMMKTILLDVLIELEKI